MYGISTYIHHKNQPNVGIYTIHGWYGIYETYMYLLDSSPLCAFQAPREALRSLEMQSEMLQVASPGIVAKGVFLLENQE